jgi:hypothetical protein
MYPRGNTEKSTQARSGWRRRVLDSYLLMLSALRLSGGAAGDRYGRRRVVLTGLAVLDRFRCQQRHFARRGASGRCRAAGRVPNSTPPCDRRQARLHSATTTSASRSTATAPINSTYQIIRGISASAA